MINSNVGFNTYLNNFKTNMVNTINDSGLPVGVVYYIMKDLLVDIQNAYENTLKKEAKQAEENKKTDDLSKIDGESKTE